MTKEERQELWTEKRSEARYAGTLLDADFDLDLSPDDAYETCVFQGNIGRRAEIGSFGMAEARRKRHAISVDESDLVKSPPTEPPPGWAEP